MKRLTLLIFASLALAGPVLVLAQSGKEVYAESNALGSADDKRLNAVYEKLIKDIRANNDKDQAEFLIQRLRESQRTWLKYRDAQIDFVGVYQKIGSASARNAGLAQYSHELTEDRINDFETVPNPF